MGLQRFLSMNGGKTLLAYCLESMEQSQLLFLADYNLEEENGLELVRFIREHLR